MAVCQPYSFALESSRAFAKELIEYVLKDFGHIWTAKRTVRQRCLRSVSMFAFTPEIGKVVVYLSRKYGGFVILASYDTWNFIKSHRDCVTGEMIYNEILSLCRKCELEDDDLGLFIFLAIAAEYARYAMIDNKQQLIDDIVKAVTFCMTDIIPGGFVQTLDRMQYRACSFEMAEVSTNSDFDLELSFTSPFTTNSTTPRSAFESPLTLSLDFRPGIQYNAPKGEIEEQLKKRELHREFSKREMEVGSYPQSDTDDNSPPVSDLRSILVNYRELNVEMNPEGMEHENSGCHLAEGVQLQESSAETENRKSESLSSVHLEDEFVGLSLEDVKEKPLEDILSRPEDSDAISKVLETCTKDLGVACEEIERCKKTVDNKRLEETEIVRQEEITILDDFSNKDRNRKL